MFILGYSKPEATEAAEDEKENAGASAAPSDGEGAGGGGGAEEEAEGEGDDMELAWQMLEVARVIYSREGGEAVRQEILNLPSINSCIHITHLNTLPQPSTTI